MITVGGDDKAQAWRTPNGRSRSGPAVNGHLTNTRPKMTQGDPQRRHIKKQSHPNIQKDGSSSVVLRMWGGETPADELRRMARAPDKGCTPFPLLTCRAQDGQGPDRHQQHRHQQHRRQQHRHRRPAVHAQRRGRPQGHAGRRRTTGLQ